MSDTGLDAILDMIRDQGGRVTMHRRAIIAALLERNDHVTADELTDLVQDRFPGVPPSTIYRCLEVLELLGVVDHVHLGHGRAVYHLTKQKHQHLLCEQCGAIIEVPNAVFAPLSRRLQASYGFAAHLRHFAILGTCERCRDAEPAARSG